MYSVKSAKLRDLGPNGREARKYIVELMRTHARYVVAPSPPSNRTSSPSPGIHEKNTVVASRNAVNEYTSPAKSSNRPSKADNTDIALPRENASSYPWALVLRPTLETNIGPK